MPNVYEASKQRIENIFDNFNKIYVSFSGGKDSSVMLHLVAEMARIKKHKIGVLFIDLEGQYKLTINHIIEMFKEYQDIIDVYWICLPLMLRNAVSVYEPRWKCWDPSKKQAWIRDKPDYNIIDDIKYFPWFVEGMEFEEFVIQFGEWYGNGESTACFVGIRTTESLNRWRTIHRTNKAMWNNFRYTTKISQNLYNIYPIYDWRTEDIWIYNGKYHKSYNKLYDLMYKAGLSIHQQRICQPYGDDQRKGLWLFQIIEPETWGKVVARVNGANYGALYCNESGNILGRIKINKPENHTWQTFAGLLLESMPENMAKHYEDKIAVFLRWWEMRGYGRGIPDEMPLELENAKKAPSWRRICKSLLINDYWMKRLSFTQNESSNRQNYHKMITKKRAAWDMVNRIMQWTTNNLQNEARK